MSKKNQFSKFEDSESESEAENFDFRIKKNKKISKQKSKKKGSSRTKTLYKRVIKKIKQAKGNSASLKKLQDMKLKYEKELGIESCDIKPELIKEEQNEELVETKNKKEEISDIIQNDQQLLGLEIKKNEFTGKFEYGVAKPVISK